MDLCDQFRLPVVHFVDQPGFLIGTDAERAGTIRRGTRALFSVFQASVPWSGDWGSLPIAGGLEAAYKRLLAGAEDPEALKAQIEEQLQAVSSPFRTAEHFSVEEIIDPRDTRPLLCAWARRAHAVVAHEAGQGPKTRWPRP